MSDIGHSVEKDAGRLYGCSGCGNLVSEYGACTCLAEIAQEVLDALGTSVTPPGECGEQYGSNPDRCYHEVGHPGSHSNRWGTTWASVLPPAAGDA